MKNFSTYLIVVFVLWIIMSGRFPNYLSLITVTRWNVSASSLFGGVIDDAISSVGNTIGKNVSSAGTAIANAITEAGAESAV